MAREVYAFIEQNLDESLERLGQLCRQPSVSAQNLGIQEMAKLLVEVMESCGINAQILPMPKGGHPAVYGELTGALPRTILFYSHYDTQPPEPLELWSSPPFEPTVVGEVMRARGVSDDKGNIAARLAAIKSFLAAKARLPVSVKFFIEGEEEIGSPHLGAFVEEHGDLLEADACLWEGGGVNWQGQPNLILGLKGILNVELEAKGGSRDVHSSLGTVVPNPAWRLIWALNSLKDENENILLDGFYDTVLQPTGEELAAVGHLPQEDEALRQSLGLASLLKGVSGTNYYRRHLFEPACNINGLLSGYTGPGPKTILPCTAKVKLDFRLVPDQRPEDILAKLRQHLDKHGFVDITITPFGEGIRPARTPINSPFVKVVAEAAKQVYGMEPEIVPSMAASGPMFYFTDVLGLPTVCIGVGYPDSRIHAPDENIRRGDFLHNIKHIAAIIERFSQAD